MPDEGGNAQEQMVPISRLNAKIEEIKRLAAQNVELEKERVRLASLTMGHEANLEAATAKVAEMEALRQQLADQEARHADDLKRRDAAVLMATGDTYQIKNEKIQGLEWEEWKSSGTEQDFPTWWAARVQEPPDYFGGYGVAAGEPKASEPTAADDGLPPEKRAAVPGTKGTKPTPPPAPTKAPGEYTPEEWAQVRADVVSKIPGYR